MADEVIDDDLLSAEDLSLVETERAKREGG